MEGQVIKLMIVGILDRLLWLSTASIAFTPLCDRLTFTISFLVLSNLAAFSLC